MSYILIKLLSRRNNMLRIKVHDIFNYKTINQISYAMLNEIEVCFMTTRIVADFAKH